MTAESFEQTAPSPTTGPPIDDAVAMLDSLTDLEVADHPQVFEAVHRILRDQLAGPSGPRG